MALRVLQPDATPSSPDDGELLERARDGDNEAFAALYNGHAEYIYALVGRLIGPVSERDDLLQDVFVRFHRALERFRGDSSVRTFISRIAVNRAHDHLRQRRRRREDFFAALDDLVTGAVDGHKAASLSSDYTTFLRCLERVATKKRVAFVLRVACEMSYGEMAELLGVKPDTARQRVEHARRELERLMRREGMSAFD